MLQSKHAGNFAEGHGCGKPLTHSTSPSLSDFSVYSVRAEGCARGQATEIPQLQEEQLLDRSQSSWNASRTTKTQQACLLAARRRAPRALTTWRSPHRHLTQIQESGLHWWRCGN